MRHFDSCPVASGIVDLLLQVDRLREQRMHNSQSLAALRPRLVEAIDAATIVLNSQFEFKPVIGLNLYQSNFGEEPTAELCYTEFSMMTFCHETGQTLLAEEGLVDDDGNVVFNHSLDEFNTLGLADILARLIGR